MVVFFVKTKLVTRRIETVKKKLKIHGCNVVELRGRSRGMALLWRDDVRVELINYSNYHISAFVVLTEQQPPWILTGFYGHLDTHKRKFF